MLHPDILRCVHTKREANLFTFVAFDTPGEEYHKDAKFVSFASLAFGNIYLNNFISQFDVILKESWYVEGD